LPGNHGRAVVVQPDGKVVVAGLAFSSAGSKCLLVRYKSDGSLDPTFGDAGFVLTTFASNYGDCFALLQDPNGKLISVGLPMAVRRFNSDGTPDTTFGNNGISQVLTTSGFSYVGYAAAIQSDGKIVAAGSIKALGPLGLVGSFLLA